MEPSVKFSASPVDPQFQRSNFDEHFMERNLLFSSSCEELRKLQFQLYSAAEYFESSYSQDPLNPELPQTLKEYVIGALVSTIDHLGVVSSKVVELVDKEVDVFSKTELRLSCAEQRIRTFRAMIDLQTSYLTPSESKHHKHYILPGGGSDAAHAVPCTVDTISKEGLELEPLREREICSSSRSKTSSLRKFFSSPSFRWGRSTNSRKSFRAPGSSFLPTTTRFSESPASSTAPSPSSDLSFRSLSFSSPLRRRGFSACWIRGDEASLISVRFEIRIFLWNIIFR
ncbi:putative protein ABIL3 isoform X2 [Wolffia australiana]